MIIELLLFIFLVMILRLYVFKSKAEKLYCKIPGPKAYPIIGNLFEFDYPNVEVTETFKKLSFQYGPVYLVKLGLENVVCLRGPADVEAVFADTKGIDKASMYDILHPWIGQGLFTSSGDTWTKQRKILTPAFHFKVVENFIPIFEKNARILVENLMKKVGGDFDVMPLVSACSLDIICETAMGLKVHAQTKDSNYLHAVDELTEIIAHRSFNAIERSFLFPFLKNGRRQKALISYLHGITYNMIEERKVERANSNEDANIDKADQDIGIKKKKPFLDLLLEYNEKGADMTDKDIREQIDTFMVAGYDTTQASISFGLHCLSQNQDVQERAYEEIQSILGEEERDPTYLELQDMRYLDKVVKETLRRFPAAQFMARKPSQDLVLNSGHTIPKGTSVMILIEAMNHDPELYPEPLKFDPDRFDKPSAHPYAYIPFGAGTRNCIGQRFATLEMKSVMSRVLRNFQLLPSNIPLKLRYDLVLRSSTGVRMSLRPRNHS